jgi:hypothetical protein
MRARYFLLRVTRYGPLVPARLFWCDHAPDDPPDNRLDRGRLSIFPRCDIAGMETDPDILLDRLGFRRRGDTGSLPHEVLPALVDPKRLTPRPLGHWAYTKPISEAEYRWRLDALRRAEERNPNDPSLKTRRRLAAADVEVPDFRREEALL